MWDMLLIIIMLFCNRKLDKMDKKEKKKHKKKTKEENEDEDSDKHCRGMSFTKISFWTLNLTIVLVYYIVCYA